MNLHRMPAVKLPGLFCKVFIVATGVFALTVTPSAAQSPQQTMPAVQFTKHILTNDFISEGVAVADVNKDGKTEIIAGAYWFEAPLWTKHEIAPPQHYSPTTEFSNSFLNFSQDVNQDGCMDELPIDL